MTTIRDTNLASNLDLSGKTVLLPVATDSVVVHPTRADFPATGRLKRLYIADDLGTLWRWTGTTYQPAPGQMDGGTY